MIEYYTNDKGEIGEIELIQDVPGVSQEPNSIVHVVYGGFPPEDDWIDSIWTNWTKAEERMNKLNDIQTVKEARIEHYTLNKPEGEWIET